VHYEYYFTAVSSDIFADLASPPSSNPFRTECSINLTKHHPKSQQTVGRVKQPAKPSNLNKSGGLQSVYRQVAGFCEHGNEDLGSITFRELLL
jgi:hypothetical protein